MHRKEIDGLRAIAVVSVIINHIDKTVLPNGYLGVDIFFVISGFVITQSLVTRQHGSFTDFILGFYNRRVKRLLPALILCVAVTCICTLLMISPQSSLSIPSLWTGIAALFGLSNLYLLNEATDYFGSSAELNPFTHTWSLGVEEQFYLLFPFLLWFSGLARQRTTGRRNFLWIICATGILSLISYIWLSSLNPLMAFYLMPTRFWELALGSIAFLVLMKAEQSIHIYSQIGRFIIIPAFALLLTALLLPQAQSYQEITTLVVVTLTSFLIVFVRPASIVYKLLTLKPIMFLGVISYSLYLWHWSVLTISRWTIGLHLWSIPFQLAAILLLAIFSYMFVEKPLRYSEWTILRIASIARVGAIGPAIVAVLSLSGAILFLAIPIQRQGYLYTGGATAPLIKKGVHTLDKDQDYKEYLWSASDCILSSNNDVGKSIIADNCTFGDFYLASRRFLVIGDSFSAAEIEMYKVLIEEGLGSVTITSAWGAGPVPELKKGGPWARANDYYWNSVIPALINKLRSGDVVLMINDGAHLINGGFFPKNKKSTKWLSDLYRGLSRMSEDLLKRGISIVYQSGNPFLRDSGCTPDTAMPQWWHFLDEPPCTYYTRKETLKRRRIYHSLLLNLQRKYSNFFVLDLFDVFCPTDVCKFYNDEGTFLYRDQYSHPSVEANILAQPLLLEVVDKIIREPLPPNVRGGDS